MKPFTKVISCFALGILLQGGFYYYLDQVVFAPTTDFNVSTATEAETEKGDFPEVSEGYKYVSHDHQYMAVVTESSAKIYKSGDSTPYEVDLKGHKLSFFEWMPDRSLAIMGFYGGPKDEVLLARFDPANPEHEVDTAIEDTPADSKIVDVAYSTATNVVYMKIKVSSNAYRIYRTDANYDTRRVYMQASNIGRIAVFYDEDNFFYDNVRTGDVFMFNGVEGGWRVINPAGRYRLIGVDTAKNIYIAKVDEDDNVLSVSEGQLGVGFKEIFKYKNAVTLSEVTMADVKKIIAEGSDETIAVTDEDHDKDSKDSKTKKRKE